MACQTVEHGIYVIRDGDSEPACFKHFPESWKPSITSGCAVGIFAQHARKDYRGGNHVLPIGMIPHLINREIVTQTIIFWHNLFLLVTREVNSQ